MAKAQEIDEPPTLYYIMRSICDFDKKWNELTRIFELAEKSREKLFFSEYPLNNFVSKKDFEIDILNHFINRRIAFETVSLFRLALVTKLREIMPGYNLMFELIASDIFTDSEIEIFNSRNENNGGYQTDNTGGYQTDNTGGYTTRNTGGYNTDKNTASLSEENTNSTKTGAFTENIENSTIEDLRNSDTPQNRLADVRAGEYVSDYNYNQRQGEEEKRNTHNDTETGRKTGNATGNEITENTHNDTDVNTHTDTDVNTHRDKDVNTHTDTDVFTHTKDKKKKTDLLNKLMTLQEYKNIMSMIYKDLDSLFLGVFEY